MGFWTTFGFKKHKMGSHFIGHREHPVNSKDSYKPQDAIVGTQKPAVPSVYRKEEQGTAKAVVRSTSTKIHKSLCYHVALFL